MSVSATKGVHTGEGQPTDTRVWQAGCCSVVGRERTLRSGKPVCTIAFCTGVHHVLTSPPAAAQACVGGTSGRGIQCVAAACMLLRARRGFEGPCQKAVPCRPPARAQAVRAPWKRYIALPIFSVPLAQYVHVASPFPSVPARSQQTRCLRTARSNTAWPVS